jgi:acyl-CoA synthetase (AMP-forming)/AMP-acid ligase II
MFKAITSINTLTELLKWRATHTPNEVAFIVEEKTYSYEWMWNRSKAFASMLMAEDVGGKDRVLVLVPNSAAFFVAFYGTILAGAIAVPVFPNAGTDRCKQIMHLSGARHVILPKITPEERKRVFNTWAEVEGVFIHWLDVSIDTVENAGLPTISADDIAFIQYTSGSTDFPKGVPLSHNNLLSNINQMVDAMSITSQDVFVSWLPVYHDMGLILNTMVPLYKGAVLVLLAEGLHKVHSWLKAIEQYKGTFISAPDVAYRLCVKSIRRPEDYNLSSLRVALNASERIQLQTYHLFEETFGLKNVMVSGYGLAEATVAVSMHPPGQPPVSDSDGYVASGKPLQGIDIKIESEEIEKGNTRVGQILVQSKSLMKGYFNQQKSNNPFDAHGYLRTGDLGYLDQEQNLYVLARKKNCIKHAGHTIYPDDIEQVVKSVEGIRQVAAIGIESPNGTGESIYIFAESRVFRDPSADRYHTLAVDIVRKINDHFGIRPGRVFLVKAKTLPRTPNGKMQHSALKDIYLNSFPQISENILYPKKFA